MIAKLQKVLKKLPKSIDEYVVGLDFKSQALMRTVTLLSDSDFYPTSLQACQRVPEYQSILQRFFDGKLLLMEDIERGCSLCYGECT